MEKYLENILEKTWTLMREPPKTDEVQGAHLPTARGEPPAGIKEPYVDSLSGGCLRACARQAVPRSSLAFKSLTKIAS